MSALLDRIKALRAAAPGMTLAEAKRLVDTGTDDILLRRIQAAELELRRRIDADRRERIAAELLAGLLSRPAVPKAPEREAVSWADLLMGELDRRRDADETEARDG